MKAASIAPASPAAVALELRQMTIEMGGLKVGLEKARTQFARAKSRLSVLTSLVSKQEDHIQSLRGTKGAPLIVSLPDYSDMRLRLSRNRVALKDARDLMNTTSKSIAEAETRLAFLEEKLKANQALLDSYGKLLHLRKT